MSIITLRRVFAAGCAAVRMDVRRKSEHRGTESSEEAGTGGGGTEKKEGEVRERANRNGAEKPPKLRGQYTARDSGSALEGGAFAGDEDCSGRLDGELFGIVTLIDGDADAA